MRAPTPRLEALLDGPSRWTGIEWHDEVTSTNDVARDHATSGAADGLVVVADAQTAGRGRSGRTWEDRGAVAEDASLLVSAIVVPPQIATLAPLATGLAAHDAVRRAGATPSLKWPNDVLVGEAKVGGILVERHETPSGPRLVIGVGLNLDWRGAPPSPEGESWTSISEATGVGTVRWDVLGDLLGGLDAWLGEIDRDAEGFVRHYAARCGTLGRRVSAASPGGVLEGVARDIDRTGALVLETAAGVEVVRAGDVHHIRAE